jgi:hypothetical protein
MAAEGDSSAHTYLGAATHFGQQVALAGVESRPRLVQLCTEVGRERYLRTRPAAVKYGLSVPSEARTTRWLCMWLACSLGPSMLIKQLLKLS